MLNKEICKKCREKFFKELISPFVPWDSEEEKLWNRGIVLCSAICDEFNNDKEMIGNAKIPAGCFYKLEQLMKSQEKDNLTKGETENDM